MRLLELVVQNVRGLPDLRLTPNGNTLVIWGANGAGKSGVVDAIDFVLTGRISRLIGAGTAGITLARHGSHINHEAESAVVAATLQLEEFDDPIRISRCIATHEELECPSYARPKLAQIGEIVRRGGLILTRRDILRYVTAEAGTRANEIQTLLNLADIEAIRESFYRARTELTRSERAARKAIDTAKAEVNVVLKGEKYSDKQLLEVVNSCRTTLGHAALDSPKSESLKKGLQTPVSTDTTQPSFNRTMFEGVVENVRLATGHEVATQISTSALELQRLIGDVKAHAELLAELNRLELTQQAIRFVEDSTTECPVCGATWPEGHLAQHLQAKLAAAQAAETEQKNITQAANSIVEPARNLRANVSSLTNTLTNTKLIARLGEDAESLNSWRDELDLLLEALGNPVELYSESDFPASSVARLLAPESLGGLLTNLMEAAKAEAPEPTPEQTAWDTLTGLEVSLRAVENRVREQEVAAAHRSLAGILLREYEKARDSVLQDLYDRIATRFVEFYGALHEHEKGHFNAQLHPDGASLRFEVDFLGRGTHPPHALHSEGHQDSMGLCLFLALNEELSQGQSDLIALDDVVMSVDTGHRKDVCRLLTEMFPYRQFLITTHDRTWAKQLRQERVVESPNLIEFTGWTVQTGPRVHQQIDIWEAITKDLERHDVPEAAFKLRRGSEDFFESVCNALGGEITYNSATQWELGDWLPSAMAQYRSLLQKAMGAAHSWGDNEGRGNFNELESVRRQIYSRTHTEQWAVNASVHYNNWANMTQDDFSPVVEAFTDLFGLFQCTSCTRMIEAVPPGRSAEVVKCPCGQVNWNLRHKPSG